MAKKRSKNKSSIKSQSLRSNSPDEVNYGFVFLAALIYAVISMIVHSISAYGSMKYYLASAYLGIWSPLMMPSNGPPGVAFFSYSFLFAFITGVLISFAYLMIRKSFTGSNTRKGLMYGFLLVLIAVIPGTLMMYLLFAVPNVLLIYWLFESILIYMLGGIVIANLLR